MSVVSQYQAFADRVRVGISPATLALVAAIPILGVIAGLAASTGNLKLVALAGAVLIGMGIAMLPRVLLWITIVTAILVSGITRLYVPELQQVRWLVPVGAWMLAAHAVGQLYLERVGAGQRGTKPVPSIAVWALAVFVIFLLSSALHWPGSESFVKGMKGYFQVWGLLFSLAFYSWPEETIRRLPKFFLAAALIQLPFVMHQYLVLVPSRSGLGDGVVAVDIIAGTFGGQIEGGGNNAVLSTFLIIVFAGLLSAWRQGVLSLKRALLFGLPLLVPVALNVSKISIVYAFAVFIVLFGQDAIRRPARFALGVLLFSGVIAVLATAYTAFAPKELNSWAELYEFTYEGNIARDLTSDGELTRGGALRFWLEQQNIGTWPEALFGYGPGMTRTDEEEGDGSFVGGPIDSEMKVGRLAVTAILWEGGLIALACVFALFASAYRAAGRLAKACTDDAMRRAMLNACQAAIVLLFISLWHKHFFVFHVGFQAIFALVFGYIAYWVRRETEINSVREDSVPFSIVR